MRVSNVAAAVQVTARQAGPTARDHRLILW